MCGCSSPQIPPGTMPDSLLTSSGNFDKASIMQVVDPQSKQQMVMIEYVGPNTASFTINSRVSQASYRFGNNEYHRTRAVFVGDVPFLLSLNTAGKRDFQLVINSPVPDTNDPVNFLGQPILA